MKPNCPNKQTFNPPTGGNRPPASGIASRGRNPGNNSGQKGKPFGKLNCTSVAEVINSEDAVIGMINILTFPAKVLFDTGATTSFISQEFLEKYGLTSSALVRPITIMSAGGNILVTQRRKQQILMICGSEYQADLFVIPMKDITVILGMDWLAKYKA